MVSNRFAVANRIRNRSNFLSRRHRVGEASRFALFGAEQTESLPGRGNRTQPGVLTLIFIHKSIERTAKRFNRTAQAFRPGKAPSKCALKGRSTGTGENESLATHVENPALADALSGGVPCGKTPGLEGTRPERASERAG